MMWEAILYSNGDLEISGKGSVRNFKSDSAPWKKYSVKRLTWIDPGGRSGKHGLLVYRK